MNILKKLSTSILKRVLLILVASVIGLLLLYGVFSIPVKNMMPHAKSSAETLYKEGLFPTKFTDETRSKLDNFTDALMIQNAIHPSSGDTLKDVLLVNHMAYTDSMIPTDDLKTETSTSLPKKGTSSEYMRYWHGYLLFLKPLLLIMDYSDIRILNLILQVVLILLLLFSMKKRGLTRFLLPFLVSWLAVSPWVLPFSMQLSTVYYIALISTNILLLFWPRIRNNVYLFFCLLGLLTSYFDYLTWPLITLGLPLIFYILMEETDRMKTLKTACSDIFLICINWGAGYGCMWAMKWVITELILHNGALTQAVGAAAYRSSAESDIPGSSVNALMVWKENISCTIYPLFVILFTVCFLILALQIYRNRSGLLERLKPRIIIPLIFTAVLPLLWYGVIKNHSFVHPYLTFRSLWISYLSVLCLIATLKRSGN